MTKQIDRLPSEIAECDDLSSLRLVLETDRILRANAAADDPYTPRQDEAIDMGSLPTWGEMPADTAGVWSYDETSLLVTASDGRYEIIPREDV